MLDRFFTRHSFKILLVAACLLPILGRGAIRALRSNDNNVQDWLPNEYQETQDFAWFRAHFANETFVLISWDGCTLEDQKLELLARKLVPPVDPNADPEDPAPTRKPPEPEKHWYSGMPVLEALFKRPGDDRVSTGGPLFSKVETGTRLLDRLMEQPISLRREEAIKRLDKLFVGDDGEQSCAVITLTEEGKRDLRYTLNKIYTVATEELSIPRKSVRMGGPPVDNVAISVEGEKTLMRLFIPAGIVGVSLAFWCLRSVRLTIMVFSAAIYAGAISLAVVHYSGGTMNAILLTMPAVVYVAGISGAIHFANYYRDTVAESGVEGAPARALQHSWLPCSLSAGTTAAGLISLYTSELVPIRMFGLYSAAGVVSTLFLLFLLLPACMQVWPMRPHSLLDGDTPKTEDIDLPVRVRAFLQGVLDRHHLVFAGLLVLMLICGYGLRSINTSIKLTKLFSPSADIIHDYTWLENKLGPLVPMEVIVEVDPRVNKMSLLDRMKLVREVQDAMLDVESIGNTMSATTFAPSLEVKRPSALISRQAASNTLNSRLEAHYDEYSHSDFLAVENGVELWRISARVEALNDIDYGTFGQNIKERVDPVLIACRARLVEATENAAKTLEAAEDDMDPERREQLAALAAVSVDGDMGISAVYTGLVPVVYKAQREMLNGLAWNFVTDLATIAAVMTVVFWDLSAGLILLIPSIFPLFIVFGLMGWWGIVIDVGTIMTPTVALGVSVDDVVHFLIWYRRGLSEGRSRKGAIMLSYEGCARAMYQSWSVLGLGLAVFALSSFVPTQRFGALMFTLLTAALIGNILMLPSVLGSPLAYFFGRRLMRQAAKEQGTESKSTSTAGTSTTTAGTKNSIPEPTIIPQHRRDNSHRIRS